MESRISSNSIANVSLWRKSKFIDEHILQRHNLLNCWYETPNNKQYYYIPNYTPFQKLCSQLCGHFPKSLAKMSPSKLFNFNTSSFPYMNKAGYDKLFPTYLGIRRNSSVYFLCILQYTIWLLFFKNDPNRMFENCVQRTLYDVMFKRFS